MDPYANLALQLNNGIPMPLPPPPPAPLAHLAPPLAVVPPAVADLVPAFLPALQLAAEAAPIQPAPLPAVSVPESHARVMSARVPGLIVAMRTCAQRAADPTRAQYNTHLQRGVDSAAPVSQAAKEGEMRAGSRGGGAFSKLFRRISI
eukprot:1049606_1